MNKLGFIVRRRKLSSPTRTEQEISPPNICQQSLSNKCILSPFQMRHQQDDNEPNVSSIHQRSIFFLQLLQQDSKAFSGLEQVSRGIQYRCPSHLSWLLSMWSSSLSPLSSSQVKELLALSLKVSPGKTVTAHLSFEVPQETDEVSSWSITQQPPQDLQKGRVLLHCCIRG